MSDETLPERIEELEEELEKIRHHVGLPSKEDDDEEDVCGEAEDDE